MADETPPEGPAPGDRDRMQWLLDLEDLGGDAFVASTPSDGPGRIFGGQVASQSLRAATLTVDAGRPPHSFHAYFIRPGRPGTPMRLDVQRSGDGKSFTTRHVTASQEGEPIFELIASFHAAEDGDDWHPPAPAGVPDPDELTAPDSPFTRFLTMSPLEVRPVRTVAPNEFPMIHPFCVRARNPLPDDQALHRCVLAFMSDMGVVGSARSPESTLPRMFMGASLDHAVWFHRPFRADEWLLFDVKPTTNFGARGLTLGTFHTRDGVLVASMAQEALLRSTGRVPLP